jgi:crossover junction endodeoxyribonuclease RuvC
VRLIGIDPGLLRTGWGIIESDGVRLKYIAHGVVTSKTAQSLAERLRDLHDGLTAVLQNWTPQSAAVEESFVNKNPESTLKLGLARGVALLVPALMGISVAEYTPNHIKKSVVGVGHADKEQVHAMVARLLPGAKSARADAADALAVAICHAHAQAARKVLASAKPMA